MNKGKNQTAEEIALEQMISLSIQPLPLKPEELSPTEIFEFNELLKKHIASFSNKEFESLVMHLVNNDRYQLLPSVYQYRSDFTDLVNDSKEFKTNPLDIAAEKVTNFEDGGRTALLLLVFGNQWRKVDRQSGEPFQTGYIEQYRQNTLAHQLGVRRWEIYKVEDSQLYRNRNKVEKFLVDYTLNIQNNLDFFSEILVEACRLDYDRVASALIRFRYSIKADCEFRKPNTDESLVIQRALGFSRMSEAELLSEAKSREVHLPSRIESTVTPELKPEENLPAPSSLTSTNVEEKPRTEQELSDIKRVLVESLPVSIRLNHTRGGDRAFGADLRLSRLNNYGQRRRWDVEGSGVSFQSRHDGLNENDIRRFGSSKGRHTQIAEFINKGWLEIKTWRNPEDGYSYLHIAAESGAIKVVGILKNHINPSLRSEPKDDGFEPPLTASEVAKNKLDILKLSSQEVDSFKRTKYLTIIQCLTPSEEKSATIIGGKPSFFATEAKKPCSDESAGVKKVEKDETKILNAKAALLLVKLLKPFNLKEFSIFVEGCMPKLLSEKDQSSHEAKLVMAEKLVNATRAVIQSKNKTRYENFPNRLDKLLTTYKENLTLPKQSVSRLEPFA